MIASVISVGLNVMERLCWWGGMGATACFIIASNFHWWKYIHVVQQRYPEKAREYGFPNDSWHNSFLIYPSLFKKGDIDDADVVTYRRRIVSSFLAAIYCGVGTIGVMVLIQIIKAYLGLTPED